MSALPARRSFAYGLLALPLAMAALPLYIHIPAYYAIEVNVGLTQLGWVLFAARLLDTMQDPLMGLYVDRAGQRLRPWLIWAAVAFGLAFWGLWSPPASSTGAMYWLAVMLVLTYSAHSFINICYLAWGASLSRSGANSQALLSAASWREGIGLVGTIVASAIPAAIMANGRQNVNDDMRWYCGIFIALLATALFLLLRYAPTWARRGTAHIDWRAQLHAVAGNRQFRALLAPYFLNALSISVPATLVLFFINDGLGAPKLASAFLVCYFVSAACGLPLWSALAERKGALATWRMSMMVAVAAFCGTLLLGDGDAAAFFVVCIAAGATLGADLVLPSVLIAQTTGGSEHKGVYFGIYTLLTKLSLSFTGLCMPLLSSLGYAPGTSGNVALVAVYAGLPCVLKLAAMTLLRRPCVEAST
jgi:Na+/melibiose symporter-like transporter